MFRKKIRKFLKLPKYPSSLPVRGFCKPGAYTWEDFHEEMKKKYPIRYFLAEEIPSWCSRNIKNKIENGRYWLKSNIIKKYHLIDIRNSVYKWGYIDPDYQVLYACFSILEKFVNQANIQGQIISIENDILKIKDEDEILFLSNQLESYYKIIEIYNWWKNEYLPNANIEKSDVPEWKRKENEMLKKLIDIREYLWD